MNHQAPLISANSPADQPSPLVQMAIQCESDSMQWFPQAYNVQHMTLGMAGEVGEFANIVKKIDRGSADPSDAYVKHAMAMELTDILIYVLNLAALLRIDLGKSYVVKRQENYQRFTKEQHERDSVR